MHVEPSVPAPPPSDRPASRVATEPGPSFSEELARATSPTAEVAAGSAPAATANVLERLGIAPTLAAVIKRARAHVPSGSTLHIFSAEPGRFHARFVPPGTTLIDPPAAGAGSPAQGVGEMPPPPPPLPDLGAGSPPAAPPIPPDEIVAEDGDPAGGEKGSGESDPIAQPVVAGAMSMRAYEALRSLLGALAPDRDDRRA